MPTRKLKSLYLKEFVKFIYEVGRNLLVYLGIAGSAVAVELMILQFGGHASPYYAGMILVGICVLGFIPAHLSFHVTSALLMYSIYFFPIILSESITDFKTFFMANFFMITIFGSTLLLRYMGVKSLINELSLKYELESALGELQKSELKYRSLVDSTEDSIYLLDRDYNYLFINKMHTSRLGISGGQYVGKSYGDFHSTEDTRAFTEIADRVFETGESIQNEYRSKIDGKYFLQTFSPVKGLYGEMTALTIISKNITERKHMEEQLRSLSLTDELTGIYNRRGVMTLAEHLLKLADRQKKGLFILYADLDNLKKVNDTFGHKEGDLALIETANLLKQNYRDSDIIGRIGGDEFVVIPVGTSSDNVDIITERFYKILAALNTAEDREYDLSISIGIAYYDPEFPCSVDELLTRADKSMYLQKRQRQKASA